MEVAWSLSEAYMLSDVSTLACFSGYSIPSRATYTLVLKTLFVWDVKTGHGSHLGKYSHWGNLFFLKKNASWCISWHALASCPNGVSGNPGFAVITGSSCGLALMFMPGWGRGGRAGWVCCQAAGMCFSKTHSILKVWFPITIYIPEE